jgi:hypothetical protein
MPNTIDSQVTPVLIEAIAKAAVGHITDEIWTAILSARSVIADCAGPNPKVLYEIGLAHAAGKAVILIWSEVIDVASVGAGYDALGVGRVNGLEPDKFCHAVRLQVRASGTLNWAARVIRIHHNLRNAFAVENDAKVDPDHCVGLRSLADEVGQKTFRVHEVGYRETGTIFRGMGDFVEAVDGSGFLAHGRPMRRQIEQEVGGELSPRFKDNVERHLEL